MNLSLNLPPKDLKASHTAHSMHLVTTFLPYLQCLYNFKYQNCDGPLSLWFCYKISAVLCMWDSSGAQSDDCDSLQLVSWFWYSETFDGCCPRLPIPIVPQPQPESRPQEHCLEQQARIHHPNSHLLLHWPLLLPDNHRWRHAQVTCILCTQTRSAVHTFLFSINAKKNSIHYEFYIFFFLYLFLSPHSE